jgi:DNA-binding LacI/PurR family transcriptional regulator
MKRANRKEVAEKAGVSEATVSFVYSKKRYVSEDLRKRVLSVAKELDYSPDYIARSMVTKTTETIAVLTNDIASPLQMEVIKSIQKEAMEKGFFVNVCGGTKNLESYIDNFIARRVDGVFVSVVSNLISDEYIKKLLDKNISVIVTSTRHIEDKRVCGLELDFVYGMNIIVDYLKSLGHQKIAYLSCFDEEYHDDNRLKTFKECIKTKFDNKNPLCICGEKPYESTIKTGYNLAYKLVNTTKDFTAIICSNDLMAMGATEALREMNYSIPNDISVVGIDDILFAESFYPPLTTLSHRAEEYGKKIFEILYDNIMDKCNVRREVVLPELIIRKTTIEAKNGKRI